VLSWRPEASATWWRWPATTGSVAGGDRHRADALAAEVPKRAWQCVSTGRGAKGHRLYDWAFIRLGHGGGAGQHWLLIRRSHTTGELAFYRCYLPCPVPLATLVRVAGQRWRIEEAFQTGKGLVAWTPIRSAAGAPGIGGSPWPCSPTPSWWGRP
jgi:hypothetical protein